MDQNQNQSPFEPFEYTEYPPRRPKRQYSLGALLSAICIAVLVAVMLTHTITAAYLRSAYVTELQRKQAQIELLQKSLEGADARGFDKLQFLATLFEQSSYYADKVSKEERLDAVLKAYAASVGDVYAEYYTEEEYAEIMAQNVGQYYGIGVNVAQTEVTVDGHAYAAFRIISIFKNAPAATSGLMGGDYIYGIKVNGEYASIEMLGGYTAAMNAIRGEEGTDVELLVFRSVSEKYESMEFCITRGSYVAESVSYTTLEGDPTVGIVQIMSFDLTTPGQFKTAVNALRKSGVEHFVFDVRNNPGGDLMSIKAVLTYFLKENELILCSVDKDGNRVTPYYAQAMTMVGDYASCNVSRDEIGMYADLDMVVLCNGNTASAAEVFTATLRDYELATVVGETTFGKGIMQSIIPLSTASRGAYDGYVKMTTYAYVTKCGIPYHEVGVSPGGEEVPLSEEAMKYNFYFLPQSLDNQLQAAVAAFDGQ